MSKPVKDKPSNYLQTRILLLILAFITVIGIIVTALSSYLYKHYLQRNLLQTAEVNLQFLVDSIDASMNSAKKLVDFCNINDAILSFAEAGDSASNSLVNRAYNRLFEEYQASDVEKYIHRIIVGSNSGETGDYLQIISSILYTNSRNAPAVARDLPYFQELLKAKGYIFPTGFVPDIFYTGASQTKVIPLIRPIEARYKAGCTGWVLLYMKEDMFTAPLAYYNLAQDSELYLTLGSYHYRLTRQGCELVDHADYSISKELATDFLTANTKAYYITEEPGNRFMVITKPLDEMEGCSITQTISRRDLNTQRTLFLTIVASIILLVVVMGLIISYLLYRTISIPVLKIRDKMELISQGDFTRDTSIEWNHELGDIGRGINDMSQNIMKLMNDRLEDEKQRRDLEYKMLQSQINPHFLYNTLNSIKWMATIQGSEGIAEMTTSLSRLLKSISKGTSILVPIREELTLLRDYFTIQEYRYGGTITLDIKVLEDSLYDCFIVKFTLQPLVENAIFHGIEPKGSAGVIKVIVETAKNSDIRIVVEDDGVGMSHEKAEKLLTDDSDSPADFFRELGVSNVHKRLQYEFGSQYGITVETKQGEYTRMIILIPRKAL